MKKIFTLFASLAVVFSAAADVVVLCNPGKLKANPLSGTELGATDGWSMKCLNETKNLESGDVFNVDGTDYRSLKLSNGAENVITLPEGLVATKVTIYATINKDMEARPCYWAKVGNETYTLENNKGLIQSYKDYANPVVQTFDLPDLNSFSVQNTGEQPFAVFAVEYKEAGDEPQPSGNEVEFSLEDYSKYGQEGSVTTMKGTYTYDESSDVYTFSKFLGSSDDFSFRIVEQFAEGSTTPNETCKIEPVAGVNVTQQDVYGSKMDILNFTGLKDANTSWFTYKGADNIRLYDPSAYGYHYSYATKESVNTTPDVTNPNDAVFVDYWKLSFTIFSKYSTPAAPETSFEPGNYNLTVMIPYTDPASSGIQDIVVDSVEENAPVEYYNLQGVRISEPAAGQIVIRRQGSTVSKVLVR